MPALCILAKMDVQTANSGLFWGVAPSLTANTGSVEFGARVLDLTSFVCSLEDVNAASTSHLPVQKVFGLFGNINPQRAHYRGGLGAREASKAEG